MRRSWHKVHKRTVTEKATNNAGPAFRPTPQRDPIFRDAKVLLFWCDQQQKEYWLDTPLCRHSKRVMPTDRPSLEPIGSYIKYSLVPCICHKYVLVLIRPSEKWWCAEQQWSEAQSYRQPWSHSPDRHTWCSQRCKRYRPQSKYEWGCRNRQPSNDDRPQR